MTHPDTFGARSTLTVGGTDHEIFRLDALQSQFDVARLPFSLKVLLENMLRTEGNGSVEAQDIETLARRCLGTPSIASMRCSRASMSRGCRSASRCCWRTCCVPKATAR